MIFLDNIKISDKHGAISGEIDLLEAVLFYGNLSHLKFLNLSKGGQCPVEVMKRVAEEMGAKEIVIGYGQTESCRPTWESSIPQWPAQKFKG